MKALAAFALALTHATLAYAQATGESAAPIAAPNAAPTGAQATQPPPAPPTPPPAPPSPPTVPPLLLPPPPPNPDKPFANWGIGPAITYDVFNSAEVSNVRVEEGIVRGDAAANADASLVFELHYLTRLTELLPWGNADRNRRNSDSVKDNDKPGFCAVASVCGWGPFIAVQAGSENIVDAIGGGWMWGFRRIENSRDAWGASQFNIGLGFMVDPKAEVLDTGYALNRPLPPGETDVRKHQDAQIEFILMFSVSP